VTEEIPRENLDTKPVHQARMWFLLGMFRVQENEAAIEARGIVADVLVGNLVRHREIHMKLDGMASVVIEEVGGAVEI
jgi:hypothetical protein